MPALAFLLTSGALTTYIAWSIGANDETMAAVGGSRIMRMGQAALLGAALDLVGATLLSSNVEETLGQDLVPGIGLAEAAIISLAVATWLVLASSWGWPVSTTHAAVGAAVGLGLAAGRDVNYGVLGEVALGWLISPALGAAGSWLAYLAFRRAVLRRARGLYSRCRVEYYSSHLLLLASSLTALSRGGNDVANATAFLKAALGGSMMVTVLGGVGMALGLATLGRRVLESVGGRLVNLTPTSAMVAQLSTAAVMLVGTLLGLPLSGTHILVSSLVGIAAAKGSPMNVSELASVAFAWIVTFPAAGALSFALARAYLTLA